MYCWSPTEFGCRVQAEFLLAGPNLARWWHSVPETTTPPWLQLLNAAFIRQAPPLNHDEIGQATNHSQGRNPVFKAVPRWSIRISFILHMNPNPLVWNSPPSSFPLPALMNKYCCSELHILESNSNFDQPHWLVSGFCFFCHASGWLLAVAIDYNVCPCGIFPAHSHPFWFII